MRILIATVTAGGGHNAAAAALDEAWRALRPGDAVDRVEDLPFRIGQLPGSKKLSVMAKAAKALGRPQAARDICEEVLRRTGTI